MTLLACPKIVSPFMSSLAQLAQAVTSSTIDMTNTLSNFLDIIVAPPSFDDSLQIYCANP